MTPRGIRCKILLYQYARTTRWELNSIKPFSSSPTAGRSMRVGGHVSTRGGSIRKHLRGKPGRSRSCDKSRPDDHRQGDRLLDWFRFLVRSRKLNIAFDWVGTEFLQATGHFTHMLSKTSAHPAGDVVDLQPFRFKPDILE